MEFFAVRNAPRTRKDQPKNHRTGGMHRLSKINPQMMQQVFSIQGLSQHKKTLSTHKDLVGSLPRQTSIDSSRPVAEPYCLPSQLTIFYKGTVNVYDISAQKAQAIMTLAGNIVGSPHQCLTVDRTTAAFSKPLSSLSKSALQHMACVDLPIARQKSLQRFLEKRKNRLNSAAPYHTASMFKQLAK